MLTTTFFRELLLTLSPPAREHTRNVLIRNQADRDAIPSPLMRYRDQNRQSWPPAAGALGSRVLTCPAGSDGSWLCRSPI